MSEVSRRELGWVALWTVGLSAVMLVVFALLGRWSWRAPMGALLGTGTAILNFYLLCRTVERAVDRDPATLRAYVRSSQYMRLLMQGAVLALAFGFKDIFQTNTLPSPEISLTIWMFFTPTLFLIAFLCCAVLNLMAALLPAWASLRKPIVESLNQKR